MNKDRLLDWQRKFDPSNFNKATGAQYHTAPTVIFPDAAEYPKNVSDESVTILFYLDSSCWVTPLEEKITIEDPIFIEKEAKGRAKHGPVFIMDAAAVYAAVPVKEGAYWSVQMMTRPEHKPLLATFTPGKMNKETGKSKIKCLITFLPEQ